ncbi:MAG: TonB-dependent receptor [Nitrospira sp.]|nr:TonB-dependent receptor [Nitrospira sp.]
MRACGSPARSRPGGLLWQRIKELVLYGNYAEGFGVPNIGSLGVTGAPLRVETSQQWEAGIKTEFFDGRWTATLSRTPPALCSAVSVAVVFVSREGGQFAAGFV